MKPDPREALIALDYFMGFAGGWMPVDQHVTGRTLHNWHHTGTAESGRLLAETVRRCDERWSHEISFGIPQRYRAAGVTRGTVLWARVEGGEQVKLAHRFRPYPSVVLQDGSSSRRLLLWPLEHTIDWFELRQFNRRLAYRFKAVQKHADPDALRVPAPGTFLRVGRSRPAPVVVTRLSTASFTAEEVVGRLKDPPEVTWEAGQMFVNGKAVAA